jgi:hypothetical protein
MVVYVRPWYVPVAGFYPYGTGVHYRQYGISRRTVSPDACADSSPMDTVPVPHQAVRTVVRSGRRKSSFLFIESVHD